MRRVARRASFGLQRRVFEGERTLLVCVTFNASRIGTGRKPCLLEFETTMRIVAITALHCPFENLVVEGLIKVRLHFTVTTYA
jgi:hypothetical protein